jgi:hypothetical protein
VRTVARLLVVVGGALCLWLVVPGTASASNCGSSGFREGAAADPSDGPRTCNNYAANGARVVGGAAVAAAIGLAVWRYRRGARATSAEFAGPAPGGAVPPPVGPAPAGFAAASAPSASAAPAVADQTRLERFAASALAGELTAQPWTRAVLRVHAGGTVPEAGVELHRPDGAVEPLAAPPEPTSTLLELRQRMSAEGRAPWRVATLTLTRTASGQLDFAVEYQYPDASEVPV